LNNYNTKQFYNFSIDTGLKKRQHIIVHSSFKIIRGSFENILVDDVVDSLKEIITPDGSVIMPAFTYCYKIKYKFIEVFNKQKTPVKVGVVAERFRTSENVIRTSSPTHSFSIWGRIKEDIGESNSPGSPLGTGSVMNWLAEHDDCFLLLLGVDFSSLTFGHYLEIKAPAPWYDFSPWNYLNVERVGVSNSGEQQLKEIPGCSKSFINFEKYLINKGAITKNIYREMNFYFLEIKLLLKEGIPYFKTEYKNLLCPEGSCRPCDERRKQFLMNVNE